MTNILAIDTSSDICSVALSSEGTTVQLCSESARQHAHDVLQLVQKLLDAATLRLQDLDALAITHGPGSFTGLRIGSAVAQGLSFANKLPVITVSSLEVIAAKARLGYDARHMQIALRARENEIYWACYYGTDNGVHLQGEEQVANISSLQDSLMADHTDWIGVGDAWVADSPLRNRIKTPIHAFYPNIQSEASMLAEIALQHFARSQTMAAELAVPQYLKEQLDYRED